MLVATPAIKLGVEVREVKVEGDKLLMSGVANAMPCKVEIGTAELAMLAKQMLKPAVLKLTIKALLGGGQPKD